MDVRDKMKPNWTIIEKRPVWGTATTKELSKILDVPLQSIHNWVLRGHFPEPEPRKLGQGHKNRFSISKIRSWLENRPIEEIEWDFVNKYMLEGLPSLEMAKNHALRYWKIYDIEKVRDSYHI